MPKYGLRMRIPVWLSVSAVRDAQGVTSHYVWIMREATPDYRSKSA